MTTLTHAVHVCPERDIECGSNPQSWCGTCPKQPTVLSDERALFEAAHPRYALNRNLVDGHYCAWVQNVWDGWQARAALATPAPASGPVLSDDRIESLFHAIDGKLLIAGVGQESWNKIVRRAFARAIEVDLRAALASDTAKLTRELKAARAMSNRDDDKILELRAALAAQLPRIRHLEHERDTARRMVR